MILYIDTSVLIAALFNETRTQDVQEWLGAQEFSLLSVSDWTLTEASAAMSMKVRSKEITLQQRAIAMAAFNQMVERSFNILSVTKKDFQRASDFADQVPSGLRAGDALHLAIAANNGSILVTLDRALAAAGPQLIVATQLL